ncbi:hypothetical protein IT411_02945 [Candidatus Peregrinibacteria bacterium]|nr:hypothetical protein [Candidatus Peregrinibacteria bacterium]
MLKNCHFHRGESIKAHRLIFDSPETAKVVENVRAAEKLETVAAISIDDNKYLFKESGEKGEIKKYMDSANKKLDQAIPAHLQLAKAQTEANKYTSEANALVIRIGLAVDALKEGEKWQDIVTKENLTNAPASLVQAIKKAKSAEGLKQVCDNFISDGQKATDNLEAAQEIDNSKKTSLENIKRTAEIALEQKQKLRFEAAKKDFIRKKINQFFPDDPKSDQQKLQEKRMLATTFIGSALDGAELKADKKEIQNELESKFKGPVEHYLVEIVKELTSSKEQLFVADFPDATPEIRAYLGGILISMSIPDGQGEYIVGENTLNFVKVAYLSIPENKRNYLPAVQEALSGIRHSQKFELKKEEAITSKIMEIFPDNSSDHYLGVKREIARQYLEGMLSSAEIQTTEKWTKSELDYYLNTVTKEWFSEYVEAEMNGKKTTGWRERPDLKAILSSGSPAANAYMEGLIDSFSYTNDQGETVLGETQVNWIIENFNKVPVNARNDVNILKTYFYNQSAIFHMDEKEHPEMKVARTIFDQDGYSPALAFYDARMIKASETFSEKAGGDDALNRYRTMLLSEISKQDPANLDLDKLNDLPMPWAFEAKAIQVNQLPPDAIAASELPKELKEYAKRLTDRTGAGDMSIQFQYNGHVYYAKKPPMKVFVVPESKDA